ncbi:MAG: hypothetical protein IPF99_34910 [Deltaproteobacteria bacterium]|nr:hypothetical protein [Deltaproteobacteria bacterium]
MRARFNICAVFRASFCAGTECVLAAAMSISAAKTRPSRRTRKPAAFIDGSDSFHKARTALRCAARSASGPSGGGWDSSVGFATRPSCGPALAVFAMMSCGFIALPATPRCRRTEVFEARTIRTQFDLKAACRKRAA